MSDIEILKRFCKNFRETQKFYKDKDNIDPEEFSELITDEEISCVENLIKENKKLKDTNKKLYELCQGNAMQEFINNECGFIPKSKIKEKIEKLERQKETVIDELNFKAFYKITDLKKLK